MVTAKKFGEFCQGILRSIYMHRPSRPKASPAGPEGAGAAKAQPAKQQPSQAAKPQV